MVAGKSSHNQPAGVMSASMKSSLPSLLAKLIEKGPIMCKRSFMMEDIKELIQRELNEGSIPLFIETLLGTMDKKSKHYLPSTGNPSTLAQNLALLLVELAGNAAQKHVRLRPCYIASILKSMISWFHLESGSQSHPLHQACAKVVCSLAGNAEFNGIRSGYVDSNKFSINTSMSGYVDSSKCSIQSSTSEFNGSTCSTDATKSEHTGGTCSINAGASDCHDDKCSINGSTSDFNGGICSINASTSEFNGGPCSIDATKSGYAGGTGSIDVSTSDFHDHKCSIDTSTSSLDSDTSGLNATVSELSATASTSPLEDPSEQPQHCALVIDCLCRPLIAALGSRVEPMSRGATTCLEALVSTETWRFASPPLVAELCFKASHAMQARTSMSANTAQLSLLCNLAKTNPESLNCFRAGLLKKGADMLINSGPWQQRAAATKLMENLLSMGGVDNNHDRKAVIHAFESLERCRLDKVAMVRSAVGEALKVAKQQGLDKHHLPLIVNESTSVHTKGSTSSCSMNAPKIDNRKRRRKKPVGPSEKQLASSFPINCNILSGQKCIATPSSNWSSSDGVNSNVDVECPSGKSSSSCGCTHSKAKEAGHLKVLTPPSSSASASASLVSSSFKPIGSPTITETGSRDNGRFPLCLTTQSYHKFPPLTCSIPTNQFSKMEHFPLSACMIGLPEDTKENALPLPQKGESLITEPIVETNDTEEHNSSCSKEGDVCLSSFNIASKRDVDEAVPSHCYSCTAPNIHYNSIAQLESLEEVMNPQVRKTGTNQEEDLGFATPRSFLPFCNSSIKLSLERPQSAMNAIEGFPQRKSDFFSDIAWTVRDNPIATDDSELDSPNPTIDSYSIIYCDDGDNDDDCVPARHHDDSDVTRNGWQHGGGYGLLLWENQRGDSDDGVVLRENHGQDDDAGGYVLGEHGGGNDATDDADEDDGSDMLIIEKLHRRHYDANYLVCRDHISKEEDDNNIVPKDHPSEGDSGNNRDHSSEEENANDIASTSEEDYQVSLGEYVANPLIMEEQQKEGGKSQEHHGVGHALVEESCNTYHDDAGHFVLQDDYADKYGVFRVHEEDNDSGHSMSAVQRTIQNPCSSALVRIAPQSEFVAGASQGDGTTHAASRERQQVDDVYRFVIPEDHDTNQPISREYQGNNDTHCLLRSNDGHEGVGDNYSEFVLRPYPRDNHEALCTGAGYETGSVNCNGSAMGRGHDEQKEILTYRAAMAMPDSFSDEEDHDDDKGGHAEENGNSVFALLSKFHVVKKWRVLFTWWPPTPCGALFLTLALPLAIVVTVKTFNTKVDTTHFLPPT